MLNKEHSTAGMLLFSGNTKNIKKVHQLYLLGIYLVISRIQWSPAIRVKICISYVKKTSFIYV